MCRRGMGVGGLKRCGGGRGEVGEGEVWLVGNLLVGMYTQHSQFSISTIYKRFMAVDYLRLSFMLRQTSE